MMPGIFKKILCPIDFSFHSLEALSTATALGRSPGAQITLVHIVRDPWSKVYHPDPGELLDPDEAEKRAGKMLTDFSKMNAGGIPCRTLVRRHEYAYQGILDLAVTLGSDLILMAAKDRYDARCLPGGSTAENLIRNSPCSLLFVKSDERYEKSALKEKLILVVDDEPDVLEAVGDLLPMCLLHKVKDGRTAVNYLMRYRYDAVILDIMGVNGFDLLKISVEKGFPTVMLSAHAVTPESLERSMDFGAAFFLPKEKMIELESYLEEVVLSGGKPVWRRLFDKMGTYFSHRFGDDLKEIKDRFKRYEEDM